MSGSASRRYPPELRERAVRMVGEIRFDHESEWAAMNKGAELLGVGSGETVGKWVRQNELIVLLSTITDPADARADERAGAYHQRWEEETAFDQLKTHLRGPGRTMRSRLSELVHQEIWAWLIVHYAIAVLIARAAEAADIDADRVSFTRALRLAARAPSSPAVRVDRSGASLAA